MLWRRWQLFRRSVAVSPLGRILTSEGWFCSPGGDQAFPANPARS